MKYYDENGKCFIWHDGVGYLHIKEEDLSMNKKYSRKRTTKGRRLLQLPTPAKTRVAISPTGPQSVLKTMDMRQSPLTHKAPRTGLSTMPKEAAHVETVPEKKSAPSIETQKISGKRTGGKVPRTRKKENIRIFAPGYLDKHTEITNIHNTNLTTRIIERPTDNPQLEPIYMDYVLEQVGSTTQLDSYKKMYPRVEIPIPAYGEDPQLVGGDDLSTSSQLLKGQTFCGFNRANVHWPTCYYDHCLPAVNVNSNLAACRSLFNRSQIRLLLYNMWVRATTNSSTVPISFDEWWLKLTEVSFGDESYGFPLDELECVFEYQNRSTSVDMYMSIYMCTPKRILKANQTPMQTWFDPWSKNDQDPGEPIIISGNSSMLMDSNYRYNPIVQCEPEVMGTSDNAGVGTNSTNPNTNPIKIYDSRFSVQTASTEVTLDATPFFSEEFKRNWRVITVHKVKLMPQQTLFYKMKLDFAKILNMKEFFSDGADGNNEHPFFFPDMTIFPMIKFWGSEVTGESKSLRQDPIGPAGPYMYRNLAQESTGPGTAPCCLAVGMECKAIVHAKSVPMYDPSFSQDWLDLLMDNFTTKSRQLFNYNDPERGISTPYYRVNQNILDFYNKPSWENSSVITTEYATALCELNTHSGDVPFNANPSPLICNWGNSDALDWTTIDTISRSKIVSTKSDINPQTG